MGQSIFGAVLSKGENPTVESAPTSSSGIALVSACGLIKKCEINWTLIMTISEIFPNLTTKHGLHGGIK